MAKRRGKGEGSVFQRKTGRQAGKWISVVDYGYVNGKQVRKYYYSDTFKEAQAKLKAGLREKDSGLLPDNQTVEKFLNYWLENTARQSVRPTTFTGYEVQVRVHLIPALGKIKLQELTPQHVQSYLNSLVEDKGKSPTTARLSRAVLRMACDQAVKWGLITRNPASLVDAPKQVRFEGQALTKEQADKLLDTVRGHRLEAWFTVALSLGLRRGESLGIRWRDVDLDNGTLQVSTSVQRLDHRIQICDVKTNSSRRKIKLPRFLIAALRAHRIRQEWERKRAGKRWVENGLVFSTTLGKPIEPRNMNRLMGTMLDKAGLPHMRVHDLRHSAGSLLLSQGMSLQAVSKLLGHSSPRVTGEVYTHIYEAEMQDLADKMDVLFGG